MQREGEREKAEQSWDRMCSAIDGSAVLGVGAESHRRESWGHFWYSDVM